MPDTLTVQCYKSDDLWGGWVRARGEGALVSIEEFAIACGDPTEGQNSKWCQKTVAHELAHTWEYLRDNRSGEHPAYNDGFNQTVGCQEDPTSPGTYTFSHEQPTRNYGRENCAEAFAVAVEEYVYNACGMKTFFPKQYEFFKTSDDSPFKSVEFCQSP